MIVFENYIISDDLVKAYFACDLCKCKGACCVEGDSGAPLREEELSVLDDIFDDLRPYLPPDSTAVIEANGKYQVDVHGEYVTPLINNKQCAYVFFDADGVAHCAIEKAFEEGIIDFRKPVSCYLYPIRISKYHHYEAVNYHQWDICKSGRCRGNEQHIKLLHFLKDPIIQRFGNEMYEMLKEAEKR